MKLKILILTLVLLFVSGCGSVSNLPVYDMTAPQTYVTFEVDHRNTYEPTTSMMKFEVEKERIDLFEKWQAYNELEMMQDRWDAWKERKEREEEEEDEPEEKTIQNSPLSLSCQYLSC